MFSSTKDSFLRFNRISGIESSNGKNTNESNTKKIATDNIFEYYYLLSKYAGIKIEDAKLSLLLLISALLIVSIFSILISSLNILFLIPLILLIFIININKKIKDRARNFEKDYPAFLLSLASVVKTGKDPLQALCDSENIFNEGSLLQAEITKTKNQLEKGETEQEAINTFADSISHPDLKLFKAAFLLSRQEGSSISSCLQRLTKVTRHRQSFRRRIKSAVAMQKLSSYGIAISACLIALMQYVTNPKAVISAINHPLGSLVLLLGVSLIVIGITWMLLVSRIRI